MKSTCLSLAAIITLILAGCSSTSPTQVDTGPIKASTFSFVNPGSQPPGYADNRKEMHALIQNAITSNLAAKGVSRVESGGDVTVAYLVIVGNNVATMSVNDYFGYGRDVSVLTDKAQDAYAISNQNPNYFEAGTLVIDVVDAKTFKLLKRTHVTRPMLREATMEVRAERIQEAVNQALANLRITH